MSYYYQQPWTFPAIYPNGINVHGDPRRCYECDSLYHVQGYCPVQKSRFTNRDNKKLMEEIVNFKFQKKPKTTSLRFYLFGSIFGIVGLLCIYNWDRLCKSPMYE